MTSSPCTDVVGRRAARIGSSPHLGGVIVAIGDSQPKERTLRHTASRLAGDQIGREAPSSPVAGFYFTEGS